MDITEDQNSISQFRQLQIGSLEARYTGTYLAFSSLSTRFTGGAFHCQTRNQENRSRTTGKRQFNIIFVQLLNS